MTVALPRHALSAFAAMLFGCTTSSSMSSPQATENPASASQASQTGAQNHTGEQDARSTTSNLSAGAFGAPCTSATDCKSGVCFEGGKGSFCSIKCTSDADCPPPSSGPPHCNPHGYCRD